MWTITGNRRVAREGTYWGITTDVGRLHDRTRPALSAGRHGGSRRISTRLARMSDKDQEALINWGYAVCDYAIRALRGQRSARDQWPYSRGLG